MNYFDSDYNIGQKIFYSFLGIVFILLALFQRYLFKALHEVTPGLTEVIFLVVIIIVFIALLCTVFFFIVLVIAVVKFIFDTILKTIEFFKNIKLYYRHFVNTVALIWNNRNKFPYSIFGGFYFYLRLRAKVIGFLFLFAFFFLIFVKCYDYAKNYHRTYWKYSFFPGQSVEECTFLPDKYYTISTEEEICAVLINKLLYEINYRTPLPHTWHIKFTDSVSFLMWLYHDPIKNSYTPLTYEIWEDKQEGIELDTNILNSYLPNKPKYNKHPKK